MKHTVNSILALLLVVSILAACQPIRPPERLPATEEPRTVTVKADEITSKALEGNLLGDPATRKFFLILPPSYATSDKRYPVVYVLPWGDGNPMSNVWGVKTAYEELLNTGSIPEMILDFPDGSNSLGASLFGTSETIGDYNVYLVRELVGFVDANYRTIARRASRGVGGCSNGGEATMNIALKYPGVFSVATVSGGTYDATMVTNPFLRKEMESIHKLPVSTADVRSAMPPVMLWFIQIAGANAPNPENPPLFLDMPFRMSGEKAEIVPEVADKIAAGDAVHAVQGYLQQPLRLRGLLVQHGLYDPYNPTELVRSFDRLLTEQGVEHDYMELKTGHCEHAWEADMLAFMAKHLDFDQPEE